ncbi:terminal deoxynucleotidyl transferase, putative [Talaromyces stipitatus ATCC 10500]|uniref:Terminal deoxynucleotidyl transferase, putative n=1 Tax=Talaromyces stipitatus (strain ATCC 10500 / CBS 375.48 / QM 6759 / NRRL 1006) TaxID=441959 RepID=B8M2L4_TALSN|nr:terminal deoxynucleotidyl transferase, putative [Talaromyces stipitatus ATCC 10500]EED21925.1 terminal deoxynucleotidyl transferase, putative [Talaromyces stipitatus ATCC 10500]
MTSSIPRAPTSSPLADDEALGTPLFANYPPMFVLPTRLTLDELHTLEDQLGRLEATLTYDVSEARIFIGTIVQRKRAALELRARGVWTEEVMSLDTAGSGGGGSAKRQRQDSSSPSPKRRRLGSRKGEGWSQQDVVDLGSTETENACVDSRASSPVQQQRRLLQSSVITAETNTQQEQNSIVQENHVKVVKLEWITQSVKAGKALNIDHFIVYHGKVIARPQEPTSTQTHIPISSVKESGGILARAIGDAASRPAPSSQSSYTSRFASSSRHAGKAAITAGGGNSSQHYSPPTLYRQTTSEHDATILIPPAPDWVKNRIMYACMRSAPLHPPNEAFINQLVKIRKVRELTLDEIGVRAYSTSIAALAAYPYELRTPVEVLSLPGCDTKIANLFVEFRNSSDGRLEAADVLDTDPVISTIHQFYNIWGVGARTAREFYYQRQWRDLDDVIVHGWNNLSRVQQIGLKYYDEFLAGIPRTEVAEIAKTIHRHAILARPGCEYDGQGIECIIVGGYRRGKETQGDIDLVLSHRDERVTKDLVLDVVGSLENGGWIKHTLALHMTTSNREQQTLSFHGDPGSHHFDSLDKALVVWQDPHFEADNNIENEGEGEVQRKNSNPHRRVDIIISPWRTVGCAVLGWSGDTTFERDLRRYAKKAHGWKFDSSGVRERTSGGHVIDLEKGGRTWEERERLVMEGLGVGWRPASERCTR